MTCPTRWRFRRDAQVGCDRALSANTIARALKHNPHLRQAMGGIVCTRCGDEYRLRGGTYVRFSAWIQLMRKCADSPTTTSTGGDPCLSES